MQSTPSDQTLTVDRISPFWAVVIVFLSNFCILVIELIAGRMMAPLVGVSLYTWTSIIGVVLAGISLGNYLGGKIADRWASRGLLAFFFGLSALGSLSILITIELTIPLSELDLPIVANMVLVFTVVFMLPATILGTISPIVVKLTLVDLNQTGDIVGKIYAAGAIGSIGGTFATGFFLISTLGTRMIVWTIAGGLLLIGAIIGLSSRGRWRYSVSVLFLLFLVASGLAWQRGWLYTHCLRETNYFCIKVRLHEENENLRILTLDRLVHSYVDMTDPTNLHYGYEQVYADVLESLFPDESSVSALFIGGGGYTFPRYIEVERPGSRIDVIEIDPGVTQVAMTHLGLPVETTITTFNEDARRFMTHLSPTQSYDLVVGDAFNDFSVPYHLTTLEFDQLVADHLNPEGIYLVNIIDGKEGRFLRAYVQSLKQVFDYVYVAPITGQLHDISHQTLVIVASRRSLDEEMAAPPLVDSFKSTTEIDAYLRESPPLILTDDFVPVDNLLAPVFADSGS